MLPALVGVFYFIGFVVESIIGFGGTLIAYAFLAIFVDIKTLIISTILLSFLASFFIVFSDYTKCNWRVISRYTGIALLGLPIGLYLFEILPAKVVLKSLAVFLILFGAKQLFLKDFYVKKGLSYVIVFISGIIHGIIGVAGPVAIIGMKDRFSHKSELRSSMAVFFILLNLTRILQLYYLNPNIRDFTMFWWVIFPIWAGVILGHHLHKKLPDHIFKKLVSGFFILSGIILIFR